MVLSGGSGVRMIPACTEQWLQGYLARKKRFPPRTLQQAYA